MRIMLKKKIVKICFLLFVIIQAITVKGQDKQISTENAELLKNYDTKITEAVKNGNKNQVAHLSSKSGIIYWEYENYDKAIQLFTQSLTFYTELRNVNGLQTVNAYLGTIYADLKNYDKAAEFYSKSLEIARQSKDKQSISSQLINLASALSLQKKYPESNKLLNEAAELSNSLNNKKLLRKVYSALAENYQKMGESAKSIEYYNFFLSFDRMIKDEEQKNLQIKTQVEVANALAEKKQKELLVSLQKFKVKAYSDSLDEQNKQNEASKLQISLLEKEKMLTDLTIKQQESDNRANRLIIYFFSLVIALTIVFSFFLVRQIVITKRTNKLLELKNIEVASQSEEIRAQSEYLELNAKELEKLSIVASKTSNAVAIADAYGQMEWINVSYTLLWGYTFHDIFEQFGGTLINPNSPPETLQAFKQCTTEKKTVTFVSKTTNRYGLEIWCQTSLTPILDESGSINKIVAIDSDISEIKQTEQKLKDSILYASRIQQAVFPPVSMFQNLFSDYFILFKPRDIVSGDFYWIQQINNNIIIAAADCTGHGVPGALMSIMGISFLNEIINRPEIENTAMALNKFRDHIKNALRQNSDDQRKEGLDIALCVYDTQTKILQFSGAYNPLYLIRNSELIEFKADKMPIGTYRKEKEFSLLHIDVQPDDKFYIFSDGYTDQFGGEKGERFKPIRFKNLLTSAALKPFSDQRNLLETELSNWQGKNHQLDDILVIGFQFKQNYPHQSVQPNLE